MLTEAAEPRLDPSLLFLILLAEAFRQDKRFWSISLEVWVFLRAPVLPRALGLIPFFFFYPLNSGKISDISLVHVGQGGGRETVIAPHSKLRKSQPGSVQPHHEGSALYGNLTLLRRLSRALGSVSWVPRSHPCPSVPWQGCWCGRCRSRCPGSRWRSSLAWRTTGASAWPGARRAPPRAAGPTSASPVSARSICSRGKRDGRARGEWAGFPSGKQISLLEG